MTNCERCRDRLLDYVYDLLEGNDLDETREHLSVCPECQAALEAVQAEQKLLACAARAVTEVAEFTLPTEAPPTVTFAPTPSADAPGSSKRPLWRRAWVGWTIAAALLIAVSGGLSYYRHTVNDYEKVLADNRQKHKEVVERFAALPATFAVAQQAAISDARSQATPYLHVVGPTTLEPSAKAHLHIKAQHPEGTPRQVQSKKDFARIDLRVKIVDLATKKLKATNLKCDDDGRAVVELEASDSGPNAKLQVIVDAKTALGTARVEESVRVLAPSYVTRIDTNKIAYQFNDVLFFRTLILDRYTMQPPPEPIAMRVELMNPKGEAVRSLDIRTGPGGVLGREFAIDDKFIEGHYALNVRPLDPAKAAVESASQPLEIVRRVALPDFKFDQDDYRAGERFSGWYLGQTPLPTNATIQGKAVPLTTQPIAPQSLGGAGGAAPGAKDKMIEPMKVAAEKKETPQSFAIPLPSSLPAGASRVPVTLEFPDGKKRTLDVPLAPTDFAIDFFPEGGDLIAGLPNRVFYRVRSGAGQPITGDGKVILLTAGKSDIVDSAYKLGMGYLDFVPHPKDTYTVNITTPTKIETVKQPFARLPMRSEGVVMQIADLGDDRAPKAVGQQGDPIRVTLRQQGPTRKLLLLAECRGQIVDQRWVDLKVDPIDVTLKPTQEAVGMIRVTAYEMNEANKGLQPVAERLVYRSANQRLELGMTLDKQQLHPGPVAGKITARDEKGQPAAAWLLASVVDERFHPRPRSLPAYFFFLNEVRNGADLDNAQLVLHDSPESAQMLERFLGTHGWRRFARTEPGIVADQPAIFSKETASADAVQKQYEQKIAQAVMPLQAAALAKRIELEDQRDRLSAAVTLAANELVKFETAVQTTVRASLGVLVIGLLSVSLILMGVGLCRIVKEHKTATPSFGVAFACLTVCIGAVFLGTWLGPPSVADPLTNFTQGPDGLTVRLALDERFALLPNVRPMTSKPMNGAFALRGSKDAQGGAAKEDRGGPGNQISEQLAANLSRRAIGDGAFDAMDRGGGTAKPRSENTALKVRFKDATAIGNPGASMGADVAPMAPPKPGVKGGAAGEQQKVLEGAGREYFHQHVKNVSTDTLLWHPNLWLQAGQADIRFDIGDGNATYRVLLLGHGPGGRFGFYETRLDVLGR